MTSCMQHNNCENTPSRVHVGVALGVCVTLVSAWYPPAHWSQNSFSEYHCISQNTHTYKCTHYTLVQITLRLATAVL